MSLVWTKEPPTEPGWYWARTKQEYPRVAMVYVDGAAPFLEMKASLEWGGSPSSHIGRPYHVWQWAGPIPQPTEPEGEKGEPNSLLQTERREKQTNDTKDYD